MAQKDFRLLKVQPLTWKSVKNIRQCVARKLWKVKSFMRIVTKPLKTFQQNTDSMLVKSATERDTKPAKKLKT